MEWRVQAVSYSLVVRFVFVSFLVVVRLMGFIGPFLFGGMSCN